MSDAFMSQFPDAHRAAHASALPGSSISTDHLGRTTVTLPRTFEPSPALSDHSPANIVSPSSPFSNVYRSTFREPQKKIVDARTVLISIDGACSNNGTSSARAGRAEILAATKALRKASAFLENVMSVGSIVLLSDSKYVVGAMTEWIFAWKDNGWKNAKGGPVENKADFKALDALIEKLEEDGLDVKFWHVGREHNKYSGRSTGEGGLRLVYDHVKTQYLYFHHFVYLDSETRLLSSATLRFFLPPTLKFNVFPRLVSGVLYALGRIFDEGVRP
ncbi:ribonuclease H-like domain-containing protein [Mycena metata]|uniref:ribonuclease H n=1 Tax=Mycena metata TaxID=1033252 RepID=A0AAD7NQU7_9AGAR|nr:ribonuclease H-like domain-containing protein [Mycena metata]